MNYNLFGTGLGETRQEPLVPKNQVSSTYLDVEEVFCEHSGALLNRDTRTIKLAAKHFSRDWHAEHVTCEFDVGLQVIDV